MSERERKRKRARDREKDTLRERERETGVRMKWIMLTLNSLLHYANLPIEKKISGALTGPTSLSKVFHLVLSA